jgi:hypothetical protein
MNAFIIHGSFGSPEENWFPWLRAELEKLGVKAFAPRFPTPEGQSLRAWMDVFEGFRESVDEETVFAGHSLGPAFILNVLQGLDRPVKACFFVAGFLGALDNPEFDRINKGFSEREFDWKRIRKNCGKFFVFYSDNDPYVPKEKAIELAARLGVKPVMVKGAGHFNEKAGYINFPLLLEKIKGLL